MSSCTVTGQGAQGCQLSLHHHPISRLSPKEAACLACFGEPPGALCSLLMGAAIGSRVPAALQATPGHVSEWIWEGCAPTYRDKPGWRQRGLEPGPAHRQGQAGSVAGAEALGRRTVEWPVPSPLPQAGIPAPGTPKAPLLGAAWHSPVRNTLGPFSCGLGGVRSAGSIIRWVYGSFLCCPQEAYNWVRWQLNK